MSLVQRIEWRIIATSITSFVLISSGCSVGTVSELNFDQATQGSNSQKEQDQQDKASTPDEATATQTNESKATDRYSQPELSNEAKIAHGKYLVHHVAQCIQCHTPRDQQGEMIESQWMTGAAIPVTAPNRSQPWAVKSVSLAGLGNYDESFVRHLLTHGARPDGTQPKNPMPTFKLNQNDADSVVAYLKSL